MRIIEVAVSLREKMENQQKGALQMLYTKRHTMLSLAVIFALLLGVWQPEISRREGSDSFGGS